MIDLMVRKGEKELLLALPAYHYELMRMMEQLSVHTLDELTEWDWIPADADELLAILPESYTISQLQLLSAWVLESDQEQYADFLQQAENQSLTMQQLLNLAKTIGGTTLWKKVLTESQLF